MTTAEVIPQYTDPAVEATSATTSPPEESEAEQRGERIHPDDVPYIMARGSLLGRIAAKRGLLITVDSATEAGITVDAPLAIDLRREIKALKHKVKAISEDMVSLKFNEPAAGDEVKVVEPVESELDELDVDELRLMEQSLFDESIQIEDTDTPLVLEQVQPQTADNSKTVPWSPFKPVQSSMRVRPVKAEGAPVCKGDIYTDVDTADFYPIDKPISDEGTPSVDKNTVEDWRRLGICVQTDPEAFHPEKGGPVREAKRICVGCDVRVECLNYALDNDERFGIWGGLSERERRRLKRRI